MAFVMHGLHVAGEGEFGLLELGSFGMEIGRERVLPARMVLCGRQSRCDVRAEEGCRVAKVSRAHAWCMLLYWFHARVV